MPTPRIGNWKRVTQAVLLAAVVGVWQVPVLAAGDLPDHYFVGRVCRGGKETQMKPPGYACEKPVRGATVTMRNSLGQVLVATTDVDGYYTLEPMPLSGMDGDTVTFEAKGLVGLRIGPLHFDTATQSPAKPGATIILPK